MSKLYVLLLFSYSSTSVRCLHTFDAAVIEKQKKKNVLNKNY